ncbi:UbiH/UbiF/VisC/COQ6 family ubiquinone biosynthesis hydroxylase [Reyranella sp.]|uniref:UbiH/UbiF/VisC/COQ6 family ubiquinone biosynthesis hydroxylase n=1 Tax=Reyranella sp. TaxID=1929291 RepID=UPI001210D3A8|nr:UbiH/UbiF/VisC/COQ6 family ubiquinone biosynthesis hydroxylase [Reyranella sp.]TAJ81735.1 MAG: 2-octaprenyl-6-methoxyphenyl hydroxylase [Reyranella sp.]
MDKERFDLAIVGAGLNGSLLALAAGEAGLSTALIDRVALTTMSQAGFDGRTTAIAYTSQRLFAALGLWDEVAAEAEPIRDIRISDAGHDGRASPLFLHFDHREAADEGTEAAPMGWIVENRFLRAALLRRLATCPQVELIAPDEVTDSKRDLDKAELTLKSGRRIATRLIASAEGRFGSMREDAGIGARAWSYDQIAIVLVAKHERPHRGVAQEKFLPGGPFAILPMTDSSTGEHRSSIVWTERADLARRLLELDGPRFQAEFARRFGDHLGAVAPIGPRWWYPLGLVHAERYIDTRLVLVGDAAHGIHPIAGQGYNLGVRDIAALVEVLIDTKRLGLDVGGADALERYAQWRRADNFTMVAATDLLNRLFSNDITPLRLARDLGLAAVNRVPPLRRFFVRHAMGLVGDLPKLIRGERP